MSYIAKPPARRLPDPDAKTAPRAAGSGPAAILAGVAILVGAASLPSSAETLARSVVVNATPAQVWSVIGPFCAIQDWLPPIGSCTQDGMTPPTRTLITRDGAATFVETETARDDRRHTYTYTFRSSPLPVSHYTSTLMVRANGQGGSTVSWRGSYTPDPGQADAARQALSGVYAAGLDAIHTRFELLGE
jgi:hypothetical protein